MKKMMKWYLLYAVILVLFTGLFSLCIGMCSPVPDETGKNITEVFSSLLGSIYLNKRTTAEIKRNCIFGIILFVCRMISRLVFSMFPDMIKGTGYITCFFIDLICLILLYSQIPDKKEEETR